jgi:hypothetical protein
VVKPNSKIKRAETSGKTTRDPDPNEEGGAIPEFYGQLWFVPDPTPLPPKVRVRRGEETTTKLVWIQKEKWEKAEFGVEDCYPVGDRDHGVGIQ